MRLFLILSGALLLTSKSFAQSPGYKDLMLALADEKYEKLMKKAENYTLDNDTRKDVLPYYYLSKANFDISTGRAQVSFDIKPDKAYKDALKYAAKFVKYDEEGEYMEEYQDYFSEIKKKFVEEVSNMILEQDWNKLNSLLRKGESVWPTDYGMKYLMGSVAMAKQDKTGARTYFEEANEHLKTLTNFDALRTEDKAIIKIGLIQYAKAMKTIRSEEKAKDAMNLGYQWFEDDAEYECMYHDIVNGEVCEN